MIDMKYIHKGGMCTTCRKRGDDCKTLPFRTMPVICSYPEMNAVIVRCTSHERIKHGESAPCANKSN